MDRRRLDFSCIYLSETIFIDTNWQESLKK